MTHPMLEAILPNWPVICVVVLSYLLGKLNFSILVLPVVLYFFLKLEASWRKKAVAFELKEKLLEETARRLILSEATESVAWLNRTLTAMWPHLDRWLSSTVRSILIRTFVAFNQPGANGKAKSVQIDVVHVSFGTQPIKIEGITAKQPSGMPYTARLDLDFCYRGDMAVELQATLPLGMKVPVALKDLEMIGKMKVELAFKDKGAIKHCSICFLTPPTLNFSIRTLGKLDIMDLPTLKETISAALILQMRERLTYPNAMTFDWSGANQSQETPEDRTKAQQKFVYETVSLEDAPLGSQQPQLARQPLSSSPPSDSDFISESSPTKRNASGSLNTSLRAPTNAPTTPEQPKDGLKQSSSPSVPRIPSAPTATPSAVPRTKPMQSFAKQKEDLNEFLLMSPEEFRGTLSVRVVECVNLPTSDLFSVSPYVSLEMNGVSFATAVVKRTSSPAWNNAVFEFPVPRYLPSKGLQLRVQVLDKSKLGSDESLGFTSINIDRFLKQPDETQFLNEPLVGAPSGRINLQIKYVVES